LARAYPEPSHIKNVLKKTPYGNGASSDSASHLPNLKKMKRLKQQLKPLSAETVKFNGRVSTDRVLFKMLLSHQIHSVLNIEKFHNLLDQEKFFEALCVVLNQLEGRISRLFVGIAGTTNGASTASTSSGGKSSRASGRSSSMSQLNALLQQHAAGTNGSDSLDSATMQAATQPRPKYYFKDKSCFFLSESMSFLKELWIRGIRIEPAGFSFFANYLETVKSIMSHGDDGSETQRQKQQQLSDHFQLACLGFVGTHLTDDHMAHAARMIRANVPTLRKLIFNRNNLTDDGVALILEALAHNNTLDLLNLSENRLSPEILSSFALFLQQQDDTPCQVRRWSLAQVNMQEEQAQQLIEALKTNDTVVEISLHNNPGIKSQTLMAITALLDINSDIHRLDPQSTEAQHMREEKSRVIDFYIEQMDEQTKALYFLRSQKPPDFLELYALRLMRDLAYLEQQISDMYHLIESHAVEVPREPKVEKSLDIMQKVSQRLSKALKGLCPRVADDGFVSQIDRYRNEVLVTLSRDEQLQDETEETLTMLKDEMERLQEQIYNETTVEESQPQMSISSPHDERGAGIPITEQQQEEDATKKQKNGEAIYESDEDGQVQNASNGGDSLSQSNPRRVADPSPELLLIAHRAKIAKLREVQTRITRRWKEVDVDDLAIEHDLKDRVVDMKLQCNAADSLGVFKNLERRFLSENDDPHEEPSEWTMKENQYKDKIRQLEIRVAQLERQNQ